MRIKTVRFKKLWKMIPLVFAILNFLIFFPPSLSSLTQSRSLLSHGIIDYTRLGVHVNGSQVVDAQGNPIYLKGFCLWDADVFSDWAMPITLERMQQIKGWGFNTIHIVAWWGRTIEPYEDQPGVYDEESLQDIENVIQLAEQAGLYVILGMRVGHASVNPPSWQGWPTAQKMVNDPVVRQRFYNLWSMLIQRFDDHPNVIGYNWWFCPWHEPPWGIRVADEVDIYYNTIVPNLIAVTRAHTEKIIFFTVYKQGGIYVPQQWEPGQEFLATGEFSFVTAIADENVVYCHGFHRPLSVEWVDVIEYDENGNRIPWDYDVDAIRRQLQPGIDFKNQYNVPLMVTEMGMHTYEYPDVQQGQFYQDRLDCYEAKLSLLEEAGWHWMYWLYSNQAGSGSGVLKVGTYDPFPIVDMLRNYIL